MAMKNITREVVNPDLTEAISQYGEYSVVELREEIDVVQMLASDAGEQAQQDNYARQAYLMRLVLFSWGVRI